MLSLSMANAATAIATRERGDSGSSAHQMNEQRFQSDPSGLQLFKQIISEFASYPRISDDSPFQNCYDKESAASYYKW